MSTLVIDSSVYVSYFGKDINTPQSKIFWQTLETSTFKIIVPALVVAETLVSLSKQQVSYLGLVHKYFKSSPIFPIDQDLIDNLSTYLNPPPKLKTSDFLIAVIAKLHSATLITWDKRLLDNQICPTLTPSQYI
ncbi:MAG: hypothetical protein G01um101416_774 [Microgenomates group bacterium Gr01-1014_16]|nr:MAG: hypothetical protein G01um101416_774 [Microgenomates group bacterium Gr01-1014_16]